MIWDEARWDGKVKEKWGKSYQSYPDEAVAGRVQDYREWLARRRLEESGENDRGEAAA